MAESLPNSEFLGLDKSGRQVQSGNQIIAESGLTNVILKQKDILEIGTDLGTFDYIIVRGVYSWVPPVIRHKLFELCRDLLAPHGVAYISYNTYPGWHLHKVLRDLMLYGTAKLTVSDSRAKRSRALLACLAQAIPKESSAYGALLAEHLEAIRNYPDSFLLHDHLEDFNEPIYFHQFMASAQSTGLQYLGEATLGEMYVGRFPASVQQTLYSIAEGIVEAEQFLDFFSNRSLRRTLLCKQGILLDRRLTSERARQHYFAADVQPENANLQLSQHGAEGFRSATGHCVDASEPIMKAALVHVGRIWPKSIQFEELLEAAQLILNERDPSFDSQSSYPEILGARLLHGAASGMIEVRLNWPRFTTEVSRFPQTTPLVRTLS